MYRLEYMIWNQDYPAAYCPYDLVTFERLAPTLSTEANA
jgi:hypothetical protein